MGGSSKKVTVGYRYYLGAHLILCHGPIDFLRRIDVDGRTAWEGNYAGGRINLDAQNLFGGDSREGGVSGPLDFETGSATQTANDYLQSRLGNVPAFRGVAGIVLRQVYMGLNPYLKPWSFRAQRIHTRQDGIDQWYDAKAQIGDLLVEPLALYLSLDFSTSMDDLAGNGKSRFENMQTSVVGLLDYIDEMIQYGSAGTVDIMIVGFGSPPSSRTSILRRDVDATDIGALKSWVNGASTSYTTYFTAGVIDAPGFFSGAPTDAVRQLVFITDGEPHDLGASTRTEIAEEAAAVLAGISDLSSYGINIDLEDTTWTAYLDNTPLDGVPVVSGSDTEALTGIIVGLMSGQLNMNPAHIIRECLTDPDWGLGYAEGDIDDTAFQAAADTLYSEGMGMSLLWDQQISIEDFVLDVIRHIDAALYLDRATGLFVLRLIRDDYVAASLAVLDVSNVERIDGLTRPEPEELVNQVTVRFWDPATGNNASISVQDTADIQMRGIVVDRTVDYPGFTSINIAARVAARDLRALSIPLVSCTLYASQAAADLDIGDAFKLDWPDYELDNLVMRVTGMALGDGRSTRMQIQCVQDVFALPAEAALETPDSGWTDPTNPPTASPFRVVTEAPYYQLVQLMGQQEADSRLDYNPLAGWLTVAAQRPSDDALNADVWVDAGGGYEAAAVADFAPSAVLSAAVGYADTAWTIEDGDGLDGVTVGTHAIIGTELVRIDAVSDSALTVGRGVLDTVPTAHSAADNILFWDEYMVSDETEYADAESVGVKLLTITGQGALGINDAPADTLVMDQRAHRPYPPGNLKINASRYPDFIAPDDVALTWSHRDRTQQTATPIDQTTGNIGPETNVEYTLKIYGEDGSLIRTETALTGTAYDYTAAQEGIDTPALPALEIEHSITNPDAETGDTTGWTAETSYGLTVKTTGVHSGSYSFVGGNNSGTSAYTTMSSVIDLDADGVDLTAVDAGEADAELDYWQDSFSGDTDSGRGGVLFLNASDVEISRSWNSWSSANGWVNRVDKHAIPPLTRKMRVLLGCDRDTGTQCSAYFDDVVICTIINSGRLNNNLRFELYSDTGTLESWQRHDFIARRVGYGYSYGYSYGGL
ncbi:MAG: hypothetical protein GY703_09535 [Gammaproteobacteria bacterium]|nr:hypothetical protein [Gammaproteobacteria bacterium]